MILVGDIHGKVDEFLALAKRFPNDQVIQLGDFGFGFFRGRELEVVSNLPGNIKFIRGNHDDPLVAKLNPNYLGDFGVMGDGTFFLGGAYSIDYEWRTPGISWWRDEELSMADLAKATALYKQTKPRIVLTHECPASVMGCFISLRPYKAGCLKSRTALALQQMLEFHQPEFWFFGHHHSSMTLQEKGTTFQCLNELEWTAYPTVVT